MRTIGKSHLVASAVIFAAVLQLRDAHAGPGPGRRRARRRPPRSGTSRRRSASCPRSSAPSIRTLSVHGGSSPRPSAQPGHRAQRQGQGAHRPRRGRPGPMRFLRLLPHRCRAPERRHSARDHRGDRHGGDNAPLEHDAQRPAAGRGRLPRRAGATCSRPADARATRHRLRRRWSTPPPPTATSTGFWAWSVVPGPLSAFGIAAAWKLLRSVQLNQDTALAGEVKESSGSRRAQIPCRYA